MARDSGITCSTQTSRVSCFPMIGWQAHPDCVYRDGGDQCRYVEGEYTMRPRYWKIFVVAVLLSISSTACGQQLPNWTARIRSDHPRLFFNADTWPAVRQRALGAERQWYSHIKGRVDRLRAEMGSEVEPKELGPQAAWAAFVFRMTGDQQYLELARKCLERSLSFYEACF